MKRKRRKPKKDQQSIAFEYYENLRSILRDLENIDSLIPKENSRMCLPEMDEEAQAIILHRKENLLRMIQTICSDHIYWGAKLLRGGWTPEQQARPDRSLLEDSTEREWIRKNTVG